MAALFVLLVAGCDGEHRQDVGSPITVQDSSGVEILTVDWESSPVAYVLSSTPDWIAGDGAGGESLLLHQVEDAELLGEDAVAIAEGSSGEIVRIGLDSRDEARWGGRGDGPAEFGAIAAVVEGAEGGIGVLDTGRQRFVELGDGGELLFEASLGHVIEGPLLEAAVGPGGAVYLAVAEGHPEGSGVLRPTGHVVRLLDWGAGDVDTVSTFLGIESVRGPEYMGLLFFGATGVMGASSGGVWLGDTATPEVTHWVEPGVAERIVRWDQIGSGTSEQEKERLLDMFFERLPPEERRFFEEQRETIPFRDELPAFESVMAGDDGTVWIGGYTGFFPEALEMPQPEQDWLVVDPEQGTAHRVVTPEGIRLVRVGTGFVLAVHRDEFGVETVRRYLLEPTEGSDSG